MRGHVLVGCSVSLVLVACGGDDKKKVVKKPATGDATAVAAKPETEVDREKKRRALAEAIVPQGSTCLPVALRDDGAPRLELGANGPDALVCAVDVDAARLLGPIGCWKVDLAAATLEYREPQLLPGRGVAVMLDDRCARGYCLPKEAKLAGKVAHVTKNMDGAKVAVLVGDDVHLFDGASKAHQSTFSIRGEKGVTGAPAGLYFIGEAILVEGGDQGQPPSVWVFKLDGTGVGPIMTLGGKEEKQVSTLKGSVSVLDPNRVGLSEKGMETLTTYQLDNGARAKLVRKLAGKPACKPAELDAYWQDGDKVTDKCKDSMAKLSGHLIGATAVAGAKNFLVLLRGERLGELGVLDAKTLAEKPEKVIKLPWCEAGGGAAKAEEASAPPPSSTPAVAADKAKRAAPKKAGDTSDPEEGGE